MHTRSHCYGSAAIGLALLSTVLVAGAQPTRPSSPGPTVTIDSGQLRGSVSDAVASFRGIPYAAAPVGQLRWRALQPPAKWQGIRSAENFGNDCVQHRAYDLPQSEDCLFLNVWAPANAVGGNAR